MPAAAPGRQKDAPLTPEGVLQALSMPSKFLGRLHRPDALATAVKANALHPGQAAYMDTYAMLLADAGQMAKALEIEKKAVELHPANHPLRLNLAKL